MPEKIRSQIRTIPWKPLCEDLLSFGVQNLVTSFDSLLLYWKRCQVDNPYTLSSSLLQLTVMDLKARTQNF